MDTVNHTSEGRALRATHRIDTYALRSALLSPVSGGSCRSSQNSFARIFARFFFSFSFFTLKSEGGLERSLGSPKFLAGRSSVPTSLLDKKHSTPQGSPQHSTAQQLSELSFRTTSGVEMSSLADVGVKKETLSSPFDRKALLHSENLLWTRQTNDDNYRRRDNSANLPILRRCRAAGSGPCVEDLVQLLFLGTVSFGFN